MDRFVADSISNDWIEHPSTPFGICRHATSRPWPESRTSLQCHRNPLVSQSSPYQGTFQYIREFLQQWLPQDFFRRYRSGGRWQGRLPFEGTPNDPGHDQSHPQQCFGKCWPHRVCLQYRPSWQKRGNDDWLAILPQMLPSSSCGSCCPSKKLFHMIVSLRKRPKVRKMKLVWRRREQHGGTPASWELRGSGVVFLRSSLV